MSPFPWRAWIAAAAMVIIGFALGVGSTIYFGGNKVRDLLGNPPPNRPAVERPLMERALMGIEKNLTEKLDLTPEEAARVQATLKEAGANLRALRQQSSRDSRAEIDRAVKKITEELPQEKRAEFRRHLANRLKWLKSQQPPPPPRREEKGRGDGPKNGS
ncbi:hypothetical protein [Oleiharenicola lentus]|uniref:hypothetical protein n=1 Tax=Oleiharenicola lentus TaxID=2508720 RepID=UPI003F66CD53